MSTTECSCHASISASNAASLIALRSMPVTSAPSAAPVGMTPIMLAARLLVVAALTVMGFLLGLVGWVERSETHRLATAAPVAMGFAALNPSYSLRVRSSLRLDVRRLDH